MFIPNGVPYIHGCLADAWDDQILFSINLVYCLISPTSHPVLSAPLYFILLRQIVSAMESTKPHMASYINQLSQLTGTSLDTTSGIPSQTPFRHQSKGRQSVGSSGERLTGHMGSGSQTEEPRIRNRIFGEFSSTDYRIIKTNIILFPLRFLDGNDETAFFTRILEALNIRSRLSAIASFMMYGLYWICVAVCLSNKTFPCSGKTAEFGFSIAMAVVTFSSWIPYIASSYLIFRKYTEASVYLVVVLVRIVESIEQFLCIII